MNRGRRKALTLAIVAHLLLFASLTGFTMSERPKPVEAAHGRIAILAPIMALFQNAQCYAPPLWAPCGPNGSHLTNGGIPVDIGDGNAGHWIFFQMDYLPSNIGGGWMQAFNEYVGCASDEGIYFSGRRIRVDVDFYDTSGNFVNWTYTHYVHIDNERWPVNQGIVSTWNNPSSTLPRWVTPTWNFNNLRNGGWLAADVAAKGPAAPTNCSTFNHVHMEGSNVAAYETARTYLEPLTDRWHDIYFYHVDGVAGLHP